jgi:hypothetical protein
MSFGGPGIVGATGLRYALTVMVDGFNIFCTPLGNAQMLSCSQLMTLYQQPCSQGQLYLVYFSFVLPADIPR